jgi:hypothetical protein
MNTYGEIMLDESPIMVLGCCHFFMAETLDGLVAMLEVYESNTDGEFAGLKGVSAKLTHSIPRCLDCNCLIRQFVTLCYNRIVNKAVIDEMSKHFLNSG